MLVPQQAAADVDDVVNDVVAAADAEPTPQSPSPPQELTSTSQVVPTPPPSPIAQLASPPPQQQPSQPTTISMDLLNSLLETCTALTRRVENLEQDKIAQALKITKLKQRVRKYCYGLLGGCIQTGGIIDDQDADKDVTLKNVEVEKNADVQGRLKESQAKVYHIDQNIDARRRKGVVIRDLEETTTPSIIIHTDLKSKDKGKGIMVQDPKPLKKKAQIEQDEAYYKIHEKHRLADKDILSGADNRPPMLEKDMYNVGNKMHKAFPLPGENSHWQYKFPLPVEGVPTARTMKIPLPGVYTAMMKKLPVKDRWQLH
nr:hypothetical protein [Tanacetum cinerariifolium]